MTPLGGRGPENRTTIRFYSPPRSYPWVAETGQRKITKHGNKQNRKHENTKTKNTKTKNKRGKYKKEPKENAGYCFPLAVGGV